MDDSSFSNVSVVIPHRNQSANLSNMLAILERQSLTPDKIVVVDDASSSVELDRISKHFRKPNSRVRIELIRLKSHSGPNVAINTGIDHVETEYVSLVACDDWLHQDFFEENISELEKHLSAGFSFSDPGLYLSSPNRWTNSKLHLASKPTFLTPEDIVRFWSKVSFTFPSNSAVFRRSKLIAIGKFHPKMEIYADWFACHALALENGACYLPKNLSWLSLTPTSYSASFNKNVKRKKKCFEYTLGRISKFHQPMLANMQEANVLPEYDIFLAPSLFKFKEWRSSRFLFKVVCRYLWSKVLVFIPIRLRAMLRATLYSQISIK